MQTQESAATCIDDLSRRHGIPALERGQRCTVDTYQPTEAHTHTDTNTDPHTDPHTHTHTHHVKIVSIVFTLSLHLSTSLSFEKSAVGPETSTSTKTHHAAPSTPGTSVAHPKTRRGYQLG